MWLSIYCSFSLSLVQATSSMTDQTLKAIDESVVIAAEFLGDFGNKKRDCLRAYAESQGIVKWIKEVTDGD